MLQWCGQVSTTSGCEVDVSKGGDLGPCKEENKTDNSQIETHVLAGNTAAGSGLHLVSVYFGESNSLEKARQHVLDNIEHSARLGSVVKQH